MSGSIVSKRYANALFQLAQEQSKVEQFETELKAVREVFQQNPSIYPFLQHPKVTNEQKKQMISESFQSLSQDLVNTLKLIIDRHREEIITDMIDEFLKKTNAQRGVADATVTSVRELSEDEKQQISKTFAAKVGKQSLNITNIVDSSLIGGIQVRVGNRIFDGSVSGKLKRMERELVSNKR